MALKNLSNKIFYQRLRLAKALKKAALDLTPPVITRSFSKGKKRAKTGDQQGHKAAYERRIDLTGKDPGDVCLVTGAPVFDIPLEQVRYTNSMSYLHPLHQMRRYYREGIEGLKDFYDSHQPQDIFGKHFLPSPEHGKCPTGGYPWSINADGSYFEEKHGSKGLSADEGMQEYGPASSTKIKMEAERLSLVKNSIQKKGFDTRHGFPTGYFLQRNSGEWVFLVLGGRHRVAAMAELGFEKIPAQFHPAGIRLVHERDSKNWPMVTRGDISLADAQKIFHVYFDSKRDLSFSNPE